MREATTKSASQRDKILTWLRMRGAQGVLNTELNELCMRFGARIYELRKAGYDIKTEKLDESRFRFVLVEAQVTSGDASGRESGAGCLGNVSSAPVRRERPAHEYRKQASLFA